MPKTTPVLIGIVLGLIVVRTFHGDLMEYGYPICTTSGCNQDWWHEGMSPTEASNEPPWRTCDEWQRRRWTS